MAAAVGDPAELLVVLVDEGARVAGLVAADRQAGRRSMSGRRGSPAPAQDGGTVEAGWPSSGPRRSGPQRQASRAAMIRCDLVGRRRRGERWGRELRSARPAGPSSRYRRTHL